MSESKCAGMWRLIEMSDGDIIKLFQSGKNGEANYRQFDGKWYVLDESTEAISEASQAKRVRELEKDVFRLEKELLDDIIKIDTLESRLAKMKEQRDELLGFAVHASEYWNGKENTSAMLDACEHIRNEALKIVASITPPDAGKEWVCPDCDRGIVRRGIPEHRVICPSCHGEYMREVKS